jgi:sigma-B regulation protein RsbU (phosphoserine phosphatase)
MNILIAEDDPVSRRILEETLINWGYEVSVTADGREAWDVLRAPGAPPLAILDIMMPEMDGLEVCRKVRQLPCPTPPYLILLTAMNSKDDVVRGILAGANDYLTKPFHRDELRARVGVGAQMLSLQKTLAERVKELEEALEKVKQLRGMLPICSYCMKVRDDQDYWQKVEDYFSEHTDVQFSHSICPECYLRVSREREDQRSTEQLQGARSA